MNIYLNNIEEETLKNTDYRRVIYTSSYSQLVLMSLKPGEEIGNEIHGLDQFIRFEQGEAKIILNNGEQELKAEKEWATIIPSGTYHNIINTGSVDLKLYTIYSPPSHLRDTIQHTKADEQEDHFDGRIDK